jgi:MOSC domain-containing protein YiiM
MANATVVALHLNVGGRKPLVPVERVNALADQGLEGDRHLRRGGHRTVLFMEQETLDEFGLAAGDVREQVTVRGVSLAELAPGSRLRIGAAQFVSGEMCAPCQRMEELRAGLRQRLEGRRGRFFRVAAAGAFTVGDTITIESPG